MQDYARKIVGGTTIFGLAVIITSIIRIFGGVIISDLLGPKKYGIYGLIISLITLVTSFSNLGADVTVAKYISEWNVNEEFSKIKRLVITLGSLKISSGIIFCGITYLLLAKLFVTYYLIPEIEFFLKIASILIILTSIFGFLSSIVRGNLKIAYLSYLNIVNSIIRVFTSIFLIIIGFGVLGAIYGTILASLSAILLGSFFISKIQTMRETIKIKASSISLSQIIKFGINSWLGDLITQIYLTVPILFLGYFFIEQVAYYTIAFSILGVSSFIQGPLYVTLMPTYSELSAKEEISKIGNTYSQTLKFLFFTTFLLTIILTSLSREIFIVLYGAGSDYIHASPILMILSLAIVFRIVGTTNEAVLKGLGRTDLTLRLAILKTLFHLSLAFILIPIYGGIGIAASYATMGIIIGVIYNLSLTKKEIKVEINRSFIIKCFLALFITFVTGEIVKMLITNPYLLVMMVFISMSLIYGIFSGIIQIFNQNELDHIINLLQKSSMVKPIYLWFKLISKSNIR